MDRDDEKSYNRWKWCGLGACRTIFRAISDEFEDEDLAMRIRELGGNGYESINAPQGASSSPNESIPPIISPSLPTVSQYPLIPVYDRPSRVHPEFFVPVVPHPATPPVVFVTNPLREAAPSLPRPGQSHRPTSGGVLRRQSRVIEESAYHEIPLVRGSRSFPNEEPIYDQVVTRHDSEMVGIEGRRREERRRRAHSYPKEKIDCGMRGEVKYSVHTLAGRARKKHWKDAFGRLDHGYLYLYKNESNSISGKEPVLNFRIAGGLVETAGDLTSKANSLILSGVQDIMEGCAVVTTQKMQLLFYVDSEPERADWKQSIYQAVEKIYAIDVMNAHFQGGYQPPPLPPRMSTRGPHLPRMRSLEAYDAGYVNSTRSSMDDPETKSLICPICSQGQSVDVFFTANRYHVRVDYSEILGRSGSNVFAGNICGRPESVAVKQIRILSPFVRKRFNAEVGMMKQFIGREGFVQYLDHGEIKVSKYSAHEVGMIVMERCDATFLDLIDGKYVPPVRDDQTYEGVLVDLVRQVLAAIETLGSGDDPIAHRDLKPDNLFIKGAVRDKKLLAKIGDFGKGREFRNREYSTTENHGHLNYLAPEVLRCYDSNFRVRFSPAQWRASDMFAVGCTVCELFSGKHPFGGRVAIASNVTSGAVCFDPLLDSPFTCRGQLCNLVCALTQERPENRPTAAQCLDHPLFDATERKVTRLSEVNAVLKRIEFGEEKSDPNRRIVFEAYDANSPLIIGKRGNWFELVDSRFRHWVRKGVDITKTSSLCRFLRNLISHLREDRPQLMVEVFGKSNMTQAELFVEFEKTWPLLDGHNAWFMAAEEARESSSESSRLFAAAQASLERRIMEEGLRRGHVAPLRTYNVVHLAVNAGDEQTVRVPVDTHVGPLVNIDKLRKAVEDLRLGAGDLKDLRGPILDGARILVAHTPEITYF